MPITANHENNDGRHQKQRRLSCLKGDGGMGCARRKPWRGIVIGRVDASPWPNGAYARSLYARPPYARPP